jgi:hypothetical protein
LKNKEGREERYGRIKKRRRKDKELCGGERGRDME